MIILESFLSVLFMKCALILMVSIVSLLHLNIILSPKFLLQQFVSFLRAVAIHAKGEHCDSETLKDTIHSGDDQALAQDDAESVHLPLGEHCCAHSQDIHRASLAHEPRYVIKKLVAAADPELSTSRWLGSHAVRATHRQYFALHEDSTKLALATVRDSVLGAYRPACLKCIAAWEEWQRGSYHCLTWKKNAA